MSHRLYLSEVTAYFLISLADTLIVVVPITMKLRSSVPGRFVWFVLLACFGVWMPNARAQNPEDLRVTPSIIGPDSVAMGDTAWYSVKLENLSGAPITILRNSLVSSDPDFTYYPLEGGDVVLDSGSKRLVRLRFTPMLGGIRLARLRILSDIITWGVNGADTASYIVDIRGVGVPYGIMEVTSDATFDSVMVGAEQCHTLEILNKGQRPLVLTSADITGAASGDFTIKGLTFPLTIEPKSRANAQICAVPTARGQRNASIEFIGTSGDRISKTKLALQVYGMVQCDFVDQATLFNEALVRLTSSTMRTIGITNCGDLPADYIAKVKGDGYKLIVWDYPFDSLSQHNVRPGDMTFFQVEFRPVKMSAHSGMLTITSAGVPDINIPLGGMGGSAILAASNTSVTTEGEPVDLNVTVTNTGNFDWSVGMPAVAGGEFVLKSSPVKIDAGGGSGVFAFTFTPVMGGSHQAQVTFPNSDNTTFNFSLHGEIETSGVMPAAKNGFALGQNYPNPFSSSSEISFVMAEAGQASLVITDIAGKIVANITEGYFEKGQHLVAFDRGALPAGSYFVVCNAGAACLSRAITIVK